VTTSGTTNSGLLAIVLVAGTFTAHAQASYRLTPIGNEPLSIRGLNEKGDAVGSRVTASGVGRAIVWRNGVVTELPSATNDPTEYSEAIGVNDRSEATGFSYNSALQTFRGAIWRDGQFHDMGFPPNTLAVQAVGINNRSQVIGTRTDNVEFNDHPFLWWNGHYSDLQPLPGDASAQVRDLNDLGFAVGASSESSTTNAVMWVFGVPIDLGTLPGTDVSTADGLNNRAQVVGASARSDQPFKSTPWLWENGHLIPLPSLRSAEGYISTPNRINDSGQIVGTTGKFEFPQPPMIATLWLDGAVYDLNDLVRPNDPLKPYVRLQFGELINNHGQIVAFGTDSRDTNHTHATQYLLTPVR
jgi:uncharacterized membrane protein